VTRVAVFRRFSPLLLCLLGTLFGACSGQIPTPVYAPLRAAEVRRPVVLVPGITGTILRDRATQKIVWGNGASLISPRDGAYALVVPLGDKQGGKDLEAITVMESVNLLGVIKKEVYAPIARMLEGNGYRRGDLAAPLAGDALFLFGYDWRRSNEEAVAQLAEALERVRQAEGRERLEVDLICQSNGAHICRYLAKYGNVSFADAGSGPPAAERAVKIAKIILIGTSNGGSLRILREIDRGRRYLPVIGRKMQPETLFTLPALYQDLPSYLEHYFLDEEGHELDLDLYNPAVWEEQGWSIFDAAARRRVARRPDLFGGPDEWRLFLGQALADAQRLQSLLHRDAPGFGVTRYYLVQNPSTPTPQRAVVVPEEAGGSRLLFTGDKELAKRVELNKLASTVGDQHASATSQLWLSPQETAAIAAEPFFVEGDHFELILNPKSLQRLLDFLADPTP
jgi:hypothetical protein